MYSGHEDTLEQLCKMEAPHLHSGSVLSNGFRSRIRRCQFSRNQ